MALNAHFFRDKLSHGLTCFVIVFLIIVSSVQIVVSCDCDNYSCDAVLDEAQGLVLATADEAIVLAARASRMLSSSNCSCCLHFPAIRIRSALVRQRHPHAQKPLRVMP
jgi:hypothetical protein